MAPQLVRANPLVREDAGRVAIQRGPVVYCLESPDQPALSLLFDAELVSPAAAFREEFRGDVVSLYCATVAWPLKSRRRRSRSIGPPLRLGACRSSRSS